MRTSDLSETLLLLSLTVTCVLGMNQGRLGLVNCCYMAIREKLNKVTCHGEGEGKSQSHLLLMKK